MPWEHVHGGSIPLTRTMSTRGPTDGHGATNAGRKSHAGSSPVGCSTFLLAVFCKLYEYEFGDGEDGGYFSITENDRPRLFLANKFKVLSGDRFSYFAYGASSVGSNPAVRPRSDVV